MVRLKEHCYFPKCFTIPCFNSNMVRLKEMVKLPFLFLLRCFNSNMVRLKGNYPSTSGSKKNMFQFQYGAIKRDENLVIMNGGK